MVTFLQQAVALESLDLSNGVINDADSGLLCEYLCCSENRLTSLNIGDNSIGRDGQIAIGNMLMCNARLRELDCLCRVQHSNANGCARIIDGLLFNTSLTSIAFAGALEYQLIPRFTQALDINRSLRSVAFAMTAWRPTDLHLLFDALGSNTRLWSLSNCGGHNAVLDTSLSASFARFLSTNTTMTNLFFPCMFANDAVVIHALHENYRLVSLKLNTISYRIELAQEEVVARNKWCIRQNVHQLILDVCIAFAPVELPAYVILWILDFLPAMEYGVKHITKIRDIEKVVKSIQTRRWAKWQADNKNEMQLTVSVDK